MLSSLIWFIKTYALPILLSLLLIDIVYSFIQHYNVSLDGDMANIILPSPAYEKVMNHPFGLPVILEGIQYPAPNRFFAHFMMAGYFKTLPFLLQKFMSPISSIYFACALAKTAIQFFLTWLIATYITGKGNLFNKRWLLAAVLFTPLFQTFGYNSLMGVIDKSITYSFFYAFSVGLTGLFLLPFFNYHFWNRQNQFNKISISLLIFLAIIIAFNGPLNPAILLISCSFFLLFKAAQHYKKSSSPNIIEKIKEIIKAFHKPTLFLFLFISLLSLYSVYLGMYNSENAWHSLPILQRYAQLPEGLLRQFTNKPGPGLLLCLMVINSLIIYYKGSKDFKEQFFTCLKWSGFLSLAYILLLPLGGYREYRPDIIRRDTILPVLLLLFFLYGLSTTNLLAQFNFRYKSVYTTAIIVFLLVFTNADSPNLDHNNCERKALNEIAQSKEKVIHLNAKCPVMSWDLIKDPQASKINTELLQFWNITMEKKLYYH